jgi:hypothetical protein
MGIILKLWKKKNNYPPFFVQITAKFEKWIHIL